MAVGGRVGAPGERAACAAAGLTMRSIRMMRGRWRGVPGVSLMAMTLAVAASTGACGGSSPPSAKTAANAPAIVAAAPPVVNSQGQQIGASAGPASGADGLTGAAKDSYDRGFQAWVSGDLQGAKAAFNDASSKAPKAAGPKYSLGCVLERLGDNQGALDAYRGAYSANGKYDIA